MTQKQTPRWDTLVRRVRKQMRLSREEFGALFGVTPEAVGHWERGTYMPSGEICWWLMQRELARVNP